MSRRRAKKFPKWLGIFLILIVVFLIIFVIASIKITGRPLSPATQKQSKLYATWIIYTNNVSHYTIQIPNTWNISEKKNISNVDSLAVFTPKPNKKYPPTLVLTSITVISHPRDSQPLTTQSEFDSWYKKNPKSYDPTSRLNKLSNFSVNGEKGVIFIDSGTQGDLKANEWSLVTWIRHNKTNFFIYTKGNSKITPGDLAGYTHMVSTLHFD